MQIFKDLNKRRLAAGLVGGVMIHSLYKLYLYANDREQFEDSNLLVTVVFILLATAIIYFILGLISNSNSSK